MLSGLLASVVLSTLFNASLALTAALANVLTGKATLLFSASRADIVAIVTIYYNAVVTLMN